ncbi:MAG: LysM peptidoglycan-binding domain-containing protein [Verrucomicrobiota bacterium]
MKKEPETSRKRSTKTLLNTLWAKPQKVSAHVTQEHDWHTEVPNVKLARVFGIVLVLHIVAVGGILAFKMIGQGQEGENAAADGSVEARIAPFTDRESDVNTKSGMDVKVTDRSRVGMKHYRVRSGDNLLAIARNLGVSVSEMEEVNNLDRGNNLYTGQVLLVPNRKIDGPAPEEIKRLLNQPVGEEVASREETLVATPVDAPAAKPAEAPEVAPAPGPAPAPAPAPSVARAEPVASTPADPGPPAAVESLGGDSYVVQKGDTPYGIARKFGISYQELMKANGIDDPRFLKIGQKITVPGQ